MSEMEEEFGYLIIGIIVVIAVLSTLAVITSLVITGFFIVVSAVASAGAVTGIFIGVKNFFKIFIDAHQEAKVKPANPNIKRFLSRLYVEQPAYLMYAYDAGWFVLYSVVSDVWTPTDADAKSWFIKGKGFLSNTDYQKNIVGKIFCWAAAIGAYVGGLCHYVAAFLIITIFALLQSVFLILGFIATSVLILFLTIYHRCPDCHYQMSIPVHICSNCSTEHTRLWPSAYGIFKHRCEGKLSYGTTCNKKLPTLSFLGKNKLVQKCPNCGRVLEGLGGTNVHIPIVGGPAVGKSHYIVTATMELLEKHAPLHKWEVSLPDTNHQRDYEACVRLITSGQRLPKTSNADMTAKAYNLQIKQKPGQVVPKLLYLYDAAGEYYTSDSSAQQQEYFKYVHGVLLIVDPFSIENVCSAYKSQLDEDKKTGGIISPSPESLETVYENMLMLFETKLNLKRNQRVRAPVAVVVTKSDAFDLEQKIGEPAARQYILDHPQAKIRKVEDAIDKVVVEFLIDYGAGNFVRNLRSHFSKVRFFSCSAIGIGNNSETASSFEGLRILDPMLWLLRQVG
jgi:Double-GTPase 2